MFSEVTSRAVEKKRVRDEKTTLRYSVKGGCGWHKGRKKGSDKSPANFEIPHIKQLTKDISE